MVLPINNMPYGVNNQTGNFSSTSIIRLKRDNCVERKLIKSSLLKIINSCVYEREAQGKIVTNVVNGVSD